MQIHVSLIIVTSIIYYLFISFFFFQFFFDNEGRAAGEVEKQELRDMYFLFEVLLLLLFIYYFVTLKLARFLTIIYCQHIGD